MVAILHPLPSKTTCHDVSCLCIEAQNYMNLSVQTGSYSFELRCTSIKKKKHDMYMYLHVVHIGGQCMGQIRLAIIIAARYM